MKIICSKVPTKKFRIRVANDIIVYQIPKDSDIGLRNRWIQISHQVKELLKDEIRYCVLYATSSKIEEGYLNIFSITRDKYNNNYDTLYKLNLKENK